MSVQRKRDSNQLNELKKFTKYIKKDSIMCEIGCYSGESSNVFLSSGKIKKFYAIDPWLSGYDDNDSASFSNMELVEKKFDDTVKRFNNVIKLKMTMKEAFDLIPDMDIIYIDGNHKYEFVLNDIILSLRKIKQGGIISGHDYKSKKHTGVTKAIIEILGEPDLHFKDKSWIKYIDKKKYKKYL